VVPSLVIGTAGHVDHGKSTLVRALTGVDPDRPGVDRVGVDRLKDEQRRGITIDLGFAHTRIGDLDVAFVDVPGHERFIRNMLAGAGGFDAVLFVVAADESVMPQTREHLAICRLLGVARGVVAITKADRVDDDTRAIVALEVGELVAGTFLERAPVVPVSARIGTGLDELRAAMASLFVVRAHEDEEPRAAVRLGVDRAFSAKGFGTVVTGTLVSGVVSEGDDLELLPARRRARVRGVHVHNRSVPTAIAPRRVALNLGQIALDEVGRGVTIATPDTLAVTRRLDVAMELLSTVPPLRHGGRVRVHLGTSDIGARVAVSASRASGAGNWQAAAVGQAAVAIPSGGQAHVRLRLDGAVAATRGDRVVVRSPSPSATLGGGVVVDPEPPARGLRRASALARFLALTAEGPGAEDEAVATFLQEAGARGLGAADLVRRAGFRPGGARDWIAAAVAEGRAVRGAGEGAPVFDPSVVAAAERAVVAALKAAPDWPDAGGGVPREALRAHLERGAPQRYAGWFDLVLARLQATRIVEGTDRVVLAGRTTSVDQALSSAMSSIDEEMKRAGLVPRDAKAVAASLSIDVTLFERAVRALVRERRLARLGDLFFHVDALAALRRELAVRAEAARIAGQAAQIDVAAFKTAYGLTRKHAIPLLEWLDRERVTRRVGETRVLL
jgi:selenocysteine-specific elongation factor